MIDIQTIQDEIARLEGSKASYPVCQKLADLYVVKDHLMKKQGEYGYYNRGGQGGGSNYTMYDDRMMEDEMGMGRSRMSMPSMR